MPGIPTIEQKVEAYNQGHAIRADLPYDVVTLNLTAAGTFRERFEGNTITVLNIGGVNPVVNMRIHKSGNAPIPLRDLVTLKHDYDDVFFEWNAIANGTITILFGVDVD